MTPTPPRAPSATLPLRYLVAAALAFAVAALAVPWLADALAGHYYQPRIFALTHTITLGWITLGIMGASYQLIPVVLERPLWSERLARWQFVVLLVGILGMIGHFLIAEWKGLVWSAGLVALGVLAHVTNVALSVRGSWRPTFTGRLVVLALGALVLTTAYGGALGLDHVVTFLPGRLFANVNAHVHLAMLGWVLPMVIGVSARVYPMFLLARAPSGRLGTVQLAGLGMGVPLVVGGLAIGSLPVLVVGALAVAAAIAGHVTWVVAMVRESKRPALDHGLQLVLTGTAFLVIATATGLGLALGVLGGPRVALAYAVLALGGWASLTIAGMMLKIVPFLVWYRVYAPRAGRGAVPTLAQLSWAGGERAAVALLPVGMALLAAGVAWGEAGWIRAAGVVTAAGVVAFGGALARALGHLIPGGAREAAPAAERSP